MKPKYFQRNTLAIATGCGAIVLALTSFAVQAAPGNTTTGTNAGVSITTGAKNTANGFSALKLTKTGKRNTAVGALSLTKNVSGSDNAAFGFKALNRATAGGNTAVGALSLARTTTGTLNTANGFGALFQNATGASNVAIGYQALYKNVGGNLNTALGDGALLNCTGSQNIGIGEDGGFNLTTGNNNIVIGNDGIAGESNKIRIGTSGVHTDTYLSGVIHGNGSGLTGLSIPASSITGAISNSQITNASINNAKLASGSVNSVKLAPNLTLGGTTTFSGNVNIPNPGATLNFGSKTRQMINLWGGGGFGLGVQDHTLYQRTDDNFAWYMDGEHSDVAFDPGPDGTKLMTLNNNAQLQLHGANSSISAANISTPGVVYQGTNNKYRSTADEEGLKIVRGGVSSTGSILKGSAYTVVRQSKGFYRITFSTPFSDLPSITGNPAECSNHYTLTTYSTTASSVIIFIIDFNNLVIDSNFDFIAIGPR